ncbi:MAG: hypothetical protein JF606_27515 [Burkholderiales bacterium]|nr:hypothetical protein [Burkholderiales bacterium]
MIFIAALASVVRRLRATYHVAMKILRDDDKEVMLVNTPSGATGYVATAMPTAAIEVLAAKLQAKIARRERSKKSSAGRLGTTPAKPGTSHT